MQNTYRFLISILLLLFVSNARAQEKETVTNDTKVKFLNGLTVQADVASLVNSFISKGETYSAEGAIQLNIKYKYFPIVELGFGGADKKTDDNVAFKTNGVFGRFGLDFNLLKQKEKPENNLLLAGFRIGVSNPSYDITNIIIKNDYWGANETINYNNQSGTKVWYEIVAGVKVEIIKNIYMGWTVRKKSLFTKNKDGVVNPWFIPGFGINATGTWGFNYSIGYHF